MDAQRVLTELLYMISFVNTSDTSLVIWPEMSIVVKFYMNQRLGEGHPDRKPRRAVVLGRMRSEPRERQLSTLRLRCELPGEVPA